MRNPPKLLLYIEDDLDDIALMQDIIHEVAPALRFVAEHNGRKALQFLSYQKQQNDLPCFILLDFNMPIMNGEDVLEALKKDDLLQKIPTAVFTTSSGLREQSICEAYGVEMVTKPAKISDFKKIISHLIGDYI